MSEELGNTQDENAAESVEESSDGALSNDSYYQQEREAFRVRMEKDMAGALRRHGFAFFHSLPPKERALYRKELGIESADPAEAYNLGVACHMDGDLKKAVKCWEQAVEMDPNLFEAEYNLALACEEMGKLDEALAHYQRFIEIAQNPDDIQRVEEHLSEMV